MKGPKYQKGKRVIIIDRDDMPVVVKITKVMTVTHTPGVRRGGFPVSKYTYTVKRESDGEVFPVDERGIESEVLYTPLCFDEAEHFEMANNLFVYEAVRDYLETLPKNKVVKGCHVVETLKRIVENLALVTEGDSQQAYDAKRELETILQ